MINSTEEKTSLAQSFCTCGDTKCPLHPANHEKGCDLCVAKNLKKGEIPTCFFKAVSEDIRGVSEFTVKSFVDFYLKHTD